ncbi:MAG TPA: CsgG/HfaB family protein [Gemmatimonadaceae bacterium]|nr:CsgG/HfaB family protein [Gemmatimonadaceae bacterium]
MNRSMKFLAALAPLVAFSPVAAQSGAPVVAVLAFENGSFGKDSKDYDGIGKGIMDIMITDLASSSKVRVVDRERVQSILAEQNLTKSGAVDGATAVRVGKLMGACYSIYGTFMRGPTGDNILTVHTTSNETGQIQNAIKVPSKGDDVMELIAKASAQFASSVDVKACPGTAGTSRPGDAAATQQGAAPAAASKTVEYARPLPPEERKKLENVKLDARTMLIYSRALDAKDRKEKAKAVALFQQVIDRKPDFTPAKTQLDALNSGS